MGSGVLATLPIGISYGRRCGPQSRGDKHVLMSWKYSGWSWKHAWFSEGVVRWDEGVIPPPNDIIGHTTFEAFINQQDIGWDHAIRGRIIVNWGKESKCAILPRKTATFRFKYWWSLDNPANIWFMGLWDRAMDFLQPSFCTEWQRMNRLIFLAKQEADRNITQLYSQADRLTPSDRFLFSIPCQVRKSRHTLSQKLLWIRTVETSLQAQHPGGMQARGDGARLRLAPRLEMLEGRRPRARYRQS